MKKYTKPAAVIEKFTVEDVITTSSGETTTVPGPTVDNDFDYVSVGLEINDEF